MLRRFAYNNLALTRIYIRIAEVLYFVITLFLGKKPRIIIRNKIKYEVDLSEGINLSLFLFGSFQNHVTQSKLLSIGADAVIFDVGANFGVMTLPLAQLAPRGKVYSFEPAHYAIEKLEKNLSLNPGLANRIKVINAFVSAKSTHNPAMKAIASWKVDHEKLEKHPLNMGSEKPTDGVGSITLDEFCEKENISRLDFIKIDTEGYESDVLEGAVNAIARYRPQIIFEVGQYSMEERGIDFSFYTSYFGKLKYKLYNAKTGVTITLDNYKKHIPSRATIDIIAKPE